MHHAQTKHMALSGALETGGVSFISWSICQATTTYDEECPSSAILKQQPSLGLPALVLVQA